MPGDQPVRQRQRESGIGGVEAEPGQGAGIAGPDRTLQVTGLLAQLFDVGTLGRGAVAMATSSRALTGVRRLLRSSTTADASSV